MGILLFQMGNQDGNSHSRISIREHFALHIRKDWLKQFFHQFPVQQAFSHCFRLFRLCFQWLFFFWVSGTHKTVPLPPPFSPTSVYVIEIWCSPPSPLPLSPLSICGCIPRCLFWTFQVGGASLVSFPPPPYRCTKNSFLLRSFVSLLTKVAKDSAVLNGAKLSPENIVFFKKNIKVSFLSEVSRCPSFCSANL